MNRHTWAGSERESCPRGSLNHFCGAFLLGFLWPIILLCLVLSLYLVYLRVLPSVHAHLWLRWILVKRPMGRLTSLPFMTSKEPFCAGVVGKVSLTSRMRKMWSLILLSGQGSTSLAIIFLSEYLSPGDKLRFLSLGPIYLLPPEDAQCEASHVLRDTLSSWHQHVEVPTWRTANPGSSPELPCSELLLRLC